MQVIYFDCFSGISGDMCLGALIDCGLAVEDLNAQINKLDLAGYQIRTRKAKVSNITSTDVTVEVTEEQPPRRLKDLHKILVESNLESDALRQSLAVFSTLAEAEAKVHGVEPEEVYFHETGAVDAIIDVVGTITGLKLLGIHQALSSPLPVSGGWVQAAHGALPLPAPATLQILQGLPVYGVPGNAELVTPTGAALIKTLAGSYGPIPPMTVQKVGYGAGKRELAQPNLLRVIVGDIVHDDMDSYTMETVGILETNIDNMNPEFYSNLWPVLASCGVLDLSLTSIQMKKGRPGTLITAICPPEKVSELAGVMLRETTSSGIRWRYEQRWVAPRWSITVQTPWGPARVKCSTYPQSAAGAGQGVNIAPEYDDCFKLAQSSGVPLKDVYDEISRIGTMELLVRD